MIEELTLWISNALLLQRVGVWEIFIWKNDSIDFKANSTSLQFSMYDISFQKVDENSLSLTPTLNLV